MADESRVPHGKRENEGGSTHKSGNVGNNRSVTSMITSAKMATDANNVSMINGFALRQLPPTKPSIAPMRVADIVLRRSPSVPTGAVAVDITCTHIPMGHVGARLREYVCVGAAWCSLLLPQFARKGSN